MSLGSSGLEQLSSSDFDHLIGEHEGFGAWIDGKPVFRHIVTFDTFAANISTAPYTDHGDIDTLISMNAALASATALVQFFGSGGGSNGLQVFFATDQIIAHHFGFTAISGHCILQYTKN